MSVLVEVFFPTAKMPRLEAWQNFMQANGFEVKFDRDFDSLSSSGFLPARYQDRPAGFEYYHEIQTDGQTKISLVFGGNVDEAISAAIAAGCLANLTGGDLVDTDSGETFQASESIAWARKCETDLLPTAERVQQLFIMPAQPASKPWWKFR